MEQAAKRQALTSRDGTVEPPLRSEIPNESPSHISTVTIDELDGPTVEELESDLQNESLELDRAEVELQGHEPLEKDQEDQEDNDAYFQNIIEEMEDMLNNDEGPSGPAVTLDPAQAKEITSALQAEGPVMFMTKYLLKSPRPVPLAQLLCALGFPLELAKAEAYSDSRLEIMVQIAMREFLRRRPRLPEPRTLDQLVKAINNAKKIIVVSGAGISTSLGIPDFRSDDGLYAQLKHLGLNDPQEVFDIKLFRQDPSIFYSVAKKILPAEKRFTPTHQFIRLLQEKGKLLRNYTQNIDNLEIEAGIDADKLVQCHGSFGIAYCFSCFRKVDGTTLYPDILAGKVPRCDPCTAKAKKLEAEDHELPDSFGVFKPEITFFGESLPDRFDDLLFKGGDSKNCDLLICMGTSLKVMPVSGIVKVVERDVPQIYISKTPCKHYRFEMSLLGACDDVVELLCKKLGWDLDHEMNRRPNEMPDTEYPGGDIETHDGVFIFKGEDGTQDASTSTCGSSIDTDSSEDNEETLDTDITNASTPATGTVDLPNSSGPTLQEID